MKSSVSVRRIALRVARRIGPTFWVWVTVIAATVFSVALFWNQGRQRRVFEHFTGQQASVHQAQRDLAKGYLHIALAGLPRSPFDRAQGLALLDQAGKSLERALELQRAFSSVKASASTDDASSYLTAYVRAMESFRATLAAEPVSPAPDPSRQAELRIAFFSLERQADAADLRIRQELTDSMRGYDRFYALVLWASGLLLLVICLAVYAGGRARKRAEAALRVSEEAYRLLVQNSGEAILFTKPDGSIDSANPAACRMFGRSEGDICRIGRAGIVDMNDPRLGAALAARGRTGMFTGELNMLRSDGGKFQAEVSASIFRDSRGAERTSMIIRDVTERNRAEEALRASLREKEVLLREIHHRVKNNMQVISSLFNLQAGRTMSDECRGVLKEGQARIRSMSLVHEKLYQSRDLSKIEFGGYVRSLTAHLFQSYLDKPDRVRLETDFEDVFLDINAAVPCGLILNELVSNALKHAFPGGRSGTIRIGLQKDPTGAVELGVADDGVGLPAGFDLRESGGFGMEIVNLLVDQLDARFEVEGTKGTSFKVTFGAIKYLPRL